MTPTLVSIVLPTYNRAEFLREAVDSVLEQTWSDWELLIIDDGSTLRTEDWLPVDPRIHVFHVAHSGNIAAVRNVGLRAATGAYVAFLDSDDRWHPDKLFRQVHRLERIAPAGWCHGAYELIDACGAVVPLRAGVPWQPREGWFVEAVLTTEAGIALQAVLVRRALAQAIGFDERIPTVDDYDFLVQLAARAPAAAVDAGPVAFIREHDGRTTNARHDHGLGAAMAYRKIRRRLSDRHLRSVCTRQTVALLRHHLANARARGEFWRASMRACRALLTV